MLVELFPPRNKSSVDFGTVQQKGGWVWSEVKGRTVNAQAPADTKPHGICEEVRKESVSESDPPLFQPVQRAVCAFKWFQVTNTS